MMNSGRTFFSLIVASLLGGLIAIGGYRLFSDDPPTTSISESQQTFISRFSNQASANTANYKVPEGLNFVKAAERVTPAVVHIKTRYSEHSDLSGQSLQDMFDGLWGEGDSDYHGGQRASSGSGIIISSDGYIVTNHHVIENARFIEVVLNDKRSYRGKLIGHDPTTDLALLKIPAKNLAFVPYGNSDDVKIGQWVLAVGNPFDLTSTVTAGIVSAKSRNINILNAKAGSYSIEAFIQTDAAVNPGNSGGALVDLNGNLIGVNTAIATSTGSYAGYSFAVPVTLVKKVMDDLLSFGEVQRALMGVNIQDISDEFAKSEGLPSPKGVYIAGVAPNSGAEDAGIAPGDIILMIEGKEVNNTSRLQELVARNRPGDYIKVTIQRGQELMEMDVVLKNKDNETEIIRSTTIGATEVPRIGAEVTSISPEEKQKLGIKNGVKVVKIFDTKLREYRVEEGFVITHVDKSPVDSPEELIAALEGLGKEFMLEGVYPNGQKVYYGLEM